MSTPSFAAARIMASRFGMLICRLGWISSTTRRRYAAASQSPYTSAGPLGSHVFPRFCAGLFVCLHKVFHCVLPPVMSRYMAQSLPILWQYAHSTMAPRLSW